MSTPVEAADPTINSQVRSLEEPVGVVFLGDRIGSGHLVTTPADIAVTGHYQWPPDAPAEVRFLVNFRILSSDVCEVAVDWPGLLRDKIGPTKAAYQMLLLLARPQFFITTPDSSHITITYLGPVSQPEIVTGLQVAVASADASHSVSLLFKSEHGQS